LSQRPSRSIGAVELVWSSASDGRWHSIHELAGYIPLKPQTVALTLAFLVRYGFARTSGMRFMIDPHAPSPRWVARRLRRVKFHHRSCSNAANAANA
jgi:hypothetical protein